jgi:hypothetical protein
MANSLFGGGTCTVVPFAGLDHAFLSHPTHYAAGIAELDRFLIAQGLIAGDPAMVASWIAGAEAHCRFDGALYKQWTTTHGYDKDGAYQGGIW